ncbi:hypothetical protein S4054249_21425 [Pseudoalteromonas luteoviolacea]|uniref:Uncharacterized protein n=1 Tax=Pseudoalteromonas luteoviolacea S4054 TaxID=1129367 RepID=A0A0F6A7I7_9GAMM|nr:hypothetical protein S4054249_21425 [Pseudoalteromonas luteoviolacea]AOT15496.1 hypothetical protein S40542_22165 [Pseudoalteromonas luteoviolacea]AOT20253.1 hypothetical protein S4054_21340 [Pseudoalteromonas luteoviolacea]KKE82202.1 hypothetical protein N479_19555 [Pseudoalteromonas luteoviolacea S4054]KZN69724.1 hypothetical protein N481_21990 [Pseudoalteromonas luteoviolacea S4047-1]
MHIANTPKGEIISQNAKFHDIETVSLNLRKAKLFCKLVLANAAKVHTNCAKLGWGESSSLFLLNYFLASS